MTMNFRQSTLAAALCAAGVTLLSGHSARADDDVKFKGGGYGTLGAVRTNLDDTQFRSSLNQYSGADKHVDLGVDSRLGLQGTVSYKSDFALTIQLLGMRREDEDFAMDVEWLYAQYTGVPGLDLKLGRVALPAFLVSDSRFVGYSTPWLRVPPLVYSMLPISTVDGGQAGYSHSIGPAVGSVQVTHGRSGSGIFVTSAVPTPGPTLYLPTTIESKNKRVTSVNGTLEWGDWTARLGQVNSDVQFTIPGAPADTIFKDKFTGLGLQYDNGKAVVIMEYVQRKTKPKTFDSDAWYVGGGYRFGEVMPYVLVSRYRPETGNKSKGVAGGLRYDFAKNIALKGEFARYDTNGTLIFTDAVTPAIVDKKVNVVSVALDFVF